MPLDSNPEPDAATNNTTEERVIGQQRKETDPTDSTTNEYATHVAQDATAPGEDLPDQRPVEHGGQSGLEPTRYGDWEKKGRCTDF